MDLSSDALRTLYRAVEQSPSTVVITGRDGNIEYVNPKFTQLTGYGAEEVIGQNPSLLNSGKQRPEFYRDMWDTVLAGKEWRGEFCNRKKDGEVYWEFASISPVVDDAGAITHFVKVAEDITARREAEEALQRHAAELEARNQELDAYAHTVAHDIKNPLAVLVGFASILEEQYETLPQEEIKGSIARIGRNARRISNIVDELLLLAGVRKADVLPEPVDVARTIDRAWERLDDLVAEYGAELAVPQEWPAVMGYEPWVEEVWVNYLSNAIKYGGCPPRVAVGAEVRERMVRFWVRDNGQGLTPEAQARLFVPFTQLAQVKAKGHGLGLSIVRRIVEKLGGEVGVESDGVTGGGSTFSFTLPAAEREPVDMEGALCPV